MMHPPISARLVFGALWLGAAVVTGCGSATPGTGGSGGRQGASGGATGTGGGGTASGGSNGSGGITGSGGASATGGVSGTGGATSSGGATGSGGTLGTGGTPPGSGGTSPGTGGGGGGTPDGGVPVATGGSAGPDGGSQGGASGSVTFNPPRAAISGGRDVTSPATQTLRLRNSGTSPAEVTRLMLGGMHEALFRVTSPAQFPVTIMPGADIAVTLQMETRTGLPPAPSATEARATGVTFLTANLTATLGSGSLQIPVFGLVALTLVESSLEPTFGQVLTALGYSMNVGKPQNDWNWNRNGTVATLGGVEAGTDEVAAQLFVKAGTGDVTVLPIARFSPEGAENFGWYRPGMSNMRTTVGAMATATSPQTSNGARTIYPPLTGATTFDPGTMPFGIWASTTPGNAMHGVLNFSQDSLNTPAGTHRVKVFTLKTASGPVPNAYMLGFEEAANGDYQDYVFILSNVRPSP